jgi:hypothetical protein
MDLLDNAAFRRLDLKVKFDYMTSDQALSMFMIFLTEASNTMTDIETAYWKIKLADLKELTPGEFTVVKRRLSLMSKTIEPSILFEELKKGAGGIILWFTRVKKLSYIRSMNLLS